jgi:hypothetical protein
MGPEPIILVSLCGLGSGELGALALFPTAAQQLATSPPLPVADEVREAEASVTGP